VDFFQVEIMDPVVNNDEAADDNDEVADDHNDEEDNGDDDQRDQK